MLYVKKQKYIVSVLNKGVLKRNALFLYNQEGTYRLNYWGFAEKIIPLQKMRKGRNEYE